MDAINIIVAINLFVSMSANFTGAKKGLKSTLSNVKKKPVTYLQKMPPNIAAIILILTIAAVFNVAVLPNEIKNDFTNLRIAGLAVFLIFSWVQVYAFKNLGNNYSQDILTFKEHNLVTTGLHKYIRHPQYLSQLLSDLGVGIALMGYIIIPLVIIIEIPLFILRAIKEESLLAENFGEEFTDYKKKSGFFIPFVG